MTGTTSGGLKLQCFTIATFSSLVIFLHFTRTEICLLSVIAITTDWLIDRLIDLYNMSEAEVSLWPANPRIIEHNHGRVRQRSLTKFYRAVTCYDGRQHSYRQSGNNGHMTTSVKELSTRTAPKWVDHNGVDICVLQTRERENFIRNNMNSNIMQ